MNRFIAIFIIAALGAGMFAGMNAVSRDMKSTADRYCDNSDMMDIRLVSTLGLTEEDIEHIKKIDGVESVFAGYFTDQITLLGEYEQVVRIHSLPADCGEDNSEYLNKPLLIEGTMPTAPDECIVGVTPVSMNTVSVGDKITIVDDGKLSDTLSVSEYTVTGLANSSYYLAFTLGTSNIGNGEVGMFMYVPEDSFCTEVYTDVHLTVEGAKNLDCFSEEYHVLVDAVMADIEEVSDEREALRYDEVVSMADAQLEEAKQEYYKAEEEVKKQLDSAFAQLSSNAALVEDGKAQLESGKTQLDAMQQMYDAMYASYEEMLNSHEGNTSILDQQINQWSDAMWDAYLKYRDYINLDFLPESMANSIREIDAFLSGLSEEERKDAINAVITGASAGGQTVLDITKASLDSYKEQLDAAQAEYDSGLAQIQEAEWLLAQGWKEYYDGKDKAEKELADAWEQILSAENAIKELANPSWYVLDRSTNYGYVNFESDANRMKSLATVLPVMFFVIAALVALTTMTRMVEEQRIIIGTYKALGYSNGKIMWKYLVYALVASLTGSALGITLFFYALPNVIWMAYSMLYTAPDFRAPFHFDIAVLAAIAMTACTMFATYFAARNILKETPASLMQPRAPKPGKRIFLERIGFIWKRMEFTSKVTARNIFRYKKRLIMTLLGISGCTALLVVGFGLKDSVSGIIGNQFTEIYNFNAQMDTVEGELGERAESILNDSKYFEDWTRVAQKAATLTAGDESVTGFILVPEESDRIGEFITFRERRSGKGFIFDENSCVIAEKAAKLLGVKVGDTVSFEYAEGKRADFTITDITENYVYLYLYISPELYEETTGQEIGMNRVLARCITDDEGERQTVSKEMLKLSAINTVGFTDSVVESFDEMLGSLNYVIIIIIIIAAVLAFVVLYNLTNININERIRELATIKVLGFRDKEVCSYIYRETIVLSILGSIIGLFLGVLLHGFTVTSVEVDMVMFGREISTMAFVYSAVLTVVFTYIVNFVMRKRLLNVDMVESMKSVD